MLSHLWVEFFCFQGKETPWNEKIAKSLIYFDDNFLKYDCITKNCKFITFHSQAYFAIY